MRSKFVEVEQHGDTDRAGPKTGFKPFRKSSHQYSFRNPVAEITCGTVGEMGAGGSRLLRGLDLGYCRVSTSRQSLERQLDVLTGAGIPKQRIYRDTRPGPASIGPG